jgi:DHA3 family macrolide efflux protein-like MFS transporter
MNLNWKKNAALFLAGQFLSLFGTMLVQHAIIWQITLKTQSGIMLTLFTLVGFLPMFFVSPFAGVWVDRFNRKAIINLADGAVALVSLLAAVSIMAGMESAGVLLLCAAVRSLGQGVQLPAVGAFIPDIVPPEHLTKINGWQSSMLSFVTLISPMLSGALMTFAPLEILFFLDVVTALIGISIVWLLVKTPVKEKSIPDKAEQKSTEYFHDLKEGLRYIMKHGYVLRMIIISAVFIFLFTPAAVLTPLQVARNFGSEVWRLSAIEITFSLGVMAGGVLIGLWGGFKNRIYTMALACLLCGLLAAGLGLTPHFWPYLVIMTALGISFPLWNAPSMVLLQTTVEPAFMGRVLAVFTMVSSVMAPVGMLVFGPAADSVSIDSLLVGTGLLVTLLSIPMLTSKTLLEAGKIITAKDPLEIVK